MGQQQGDILLHCGEEKASEFALQAAWNAAHHGAEGEQVLALWPLLLHRRTSDPLVPLNRRRFVV